MIYAYLLCIFIVLLGIMSSGAFRRLAKSATATAFTRNNLHARPSTAAAAAAASVNLNRHTSLAKVGTTRGSRAMRLATALYALSASSTTAAPAVAPVEYFRKDYKPLPYSTEEIYMDFHLGLAESTLTTKNAIKRSSIAVEDLVFNGEDTLDLVDIKVNDKQLTSDEYIILPDGDLQISANALPKGTDFMVETTVKLQPNKNLALSGLYASSGVFRVPLLLFTLSHTHT